MVKKAIIQAENNKLIQVTHFMSSNSGLAIVCSPNFDKFIT